jgi:hypothetical protein
LYHVFVNGRKCECNRSSSKAGSSDASLLALVLVALRHFGQALGHRERMA